MKTLVKFILKATAKAAVVVGLAVGCLLPSQAQAQQGVVNRYGKFFTNSFVVITNGTAQTFTTTANVFRDRGMSFLLSQVSTNAATASTVLRWDVSHDGTNYTSTTKAPLLWYSPLNGTTAQLDWTNFTKDVLDNVRSVKLTISNAHTAPIYVSNVFWSVFP